MRCLRLKDMLLKKLCSPVCLPVPLSAQVLGELEIAHPVCAAEDLKRPCGRGDSGLGLIEIILFFALFVLVVGLLSPMVLQQLVSSRVNNTREEMQQIQTAILGDLKAGTYGFVGDMGRLPLNLQELKSPLPGTSLYSVEHARGVGMGWNGPYANWGKHAEDYLTDGFGTAYDYGVVGAGQLRSAGPDLTMGTADDLVVPPQPIHFTGRLAVTVRASDGQVYLTDPPNCRVLVYYSENGAERSIAATAPPYLFENLARGPHAASASCGGQNPAGPPDSSVTVAVQGYGQTNMVDLVVLAPLSSTAANSPGEPSAANDPLGEARDMLLHQQNLILQRPDLSSMLKGQYEAAGSRILSSIDLATKQMDNKDLEARRRNLQQAMRELDVLYGFVRQSPIGNPQSKDGQAVLEMETPIRERLARSIPGAAGNWPPK